MTANNPITKIAEELGLSPLSSFDDVITHIRYMKGLIRKMSRPGLIEQAPEKYQADTKHVQEMK